MTREEIEEDLANALGATVYYRRGSIRVSVPKVVKKLKTEMEYDTFRVVGLNYGILRDALTRIGQIIEDRPERDEIIARVGAGFADMNFAVMVVSFTGEYISVASYAKEGLVKQRTAKKAIDNLKRSLSGLYLND